MNFDSLLTELRFEYVSSLPEKIQVIRQFYNTGNTSGVREAFHKLKGTGTTYGVPEISMVGEALEQFCKAKPLELTRVLPDALTLLDLIHVARSKNEEFHVMSDTRFQRIQQLLK